jgi:hypothetical protein
LPYTLPSNLFMFYFPSVSTKKTVEYILATVKKVTDLFEYFNFGCDLSITIPASSTSFLCKHNELYTRHEDIHSCQALIFLHNESYPTHGIFTMAPLFYNYFTPTGCFFLFESKYGMPLPFTRQNYSIV